MKRTKLVAALVAFMVPAAAFAQPAATPAPTAEDLVKAADAAAEAAAVSESAKVADATTANADDDIDLASLGLDPNASAFDDKLNIYGFADFQWSYMYFTKKIPPLGSTGGFQSGGLNLYLSKNLTEKLRFLAEVRFTYLPNGGVTLATGVVTDTSVADPTNFSRPVQVGGITIERAYVDYDLHKYLTIRAGRYLTPYGVWNTDHGSPAIVPGNRPYIIGEQYFPEHQTGLELYGVMPVRDMKLRYHATVSNGRGPIEANEDPDRRPAFGGRLEIEAALAGGTMKVGASGYGGPWMQANQGYGVKRVSYDERSYGADAQWTDGKLLVQGEVIGNERAYRTDARAKSPGGFAPDGNQWGAYALLGYRTERLWNVMPFVIYEYNAPLDKILYNDLHSYSAGLNFRPTPTFVLKAQYSYGSLSGDERSFLKGADAVVTLLMAAWVF